MSNIDFVITWVDGRDPEWRKRKEALSENSFEDEREERYRDWGLLPYWFRGVEKYAPWVGKIWFICDQNPPEWLNRDHPKLNIVRHEDYPPDEYRPAFSSHPIELNLHRIKGLSERFVYFNDDMFLLRPVKESMFFRRGLPCDSALLNTIPTDDLAGVPDGRIFYMFLNNASYINRDYDFRSCLKRNPLKWLHPAYGKDLVRNAMLCIWPRLVGTVELHLPQAFLKRTFREAWEKDFDILDMTSRHHFRNDLDVNQWLVRLHHIMKGEFSVRKPIRNAVFTLGRDNEELARTVREQKIPMICINDASMDTQTYTDSKREIQAAFDALLPQPSMFEIR